MFVWVNIPWLGEPRGWMGEYLVAGWVDTTWLGELIYNTVLAAPRMLDRSVSLYDAAKEEVTYQYRQQE